MNFGRETNMDKERFRNYFKSKASCNATKPGHGANDDVTITGVFASATNVAEPADIAMAEAELKKAVRPAKYASKVSSKLQAEVARYATSFGATAAMKYFQKKHPKLKFTRTTIQGWVKRWIRTIMCKSNALVDQTYWGTIC